ncbi:hypothetical protein WN944_010963 [Citrus x changshan-huyou]|uniref:Uncharacterized protein n=1 Tax=Citrus x changshan-huyou TaxID=2935761 RepID=A0AAP0MYG4_9ROSI
MADNKQLAEALEKVKRRRVTGRVGKIRIQIRIAFFISGSVNFFADPDAGSKKPSSVTARQRDFDKHCAAWSLGRPSELRQIRRASTIDQTSFNDRSSEAPAS